MMIASTGWGGMGVALIAAAFVMRWFKYGQLRKPKGRRR